ncbi:MAG: hypothetical protein HKN21_05670, partial [Candidatus Eisenbacteria bacterium]|nr:hypothetical protein [Candidatus Eisenbacteria bacterium]
MRHAFRFVLCSLVFAAAAFASSTAQAETNPVNLALFNPIQIFGEDTSVEGVRVNLIYGKNRDVTGLDLGLIN